VEDDPKILRLANTFVKEHGRGAAFFAAKRADKERARGDHIAAAFWTRVMMAIDALQQQKPDTSARVERRSRGPASTD